MRSILSESVFEYHSAHAFASRMDQIEKSIGFRPGLDGGHPFSKIFRDAVNFDL